MKKEIDIKVVYDTREKDISYIRHIKLDKRRGKDGIKFISCERAICKPLDCVISTGDITYAWKLKDDSEWTQSPFSIEIKKGMDLFSSLYSKSNFDRLKREIDRAEASKIGFYFLVTDSIYQTRKGLEKVKKVGRNADTIYFGKLLELNKYLTNSGFDSIITTGKSKDTLAFCIRRLIKDSVKKLKLK